MKFVRLSSNFPVTKLENNLKKANYYKDGDEAYTLWDVGDFDKNQLGIHLSYNSDKKKIVAYYEDGVEHKNFFAPITEVFTGKIVCLLFLILLLFFATLPSLVYLSVLKTNVPI